MKLWKERWGSLGKNINAMKWMKLEVFEKTDQNGWTWEQRSSLNSWNKASFFFVLQTLDVFLAKLGFLFRFVWIWLLHCTMIGFWLSYDFGLFQLLVFVHADYDVFISLWWGCMIITQKIKLGTHSSCLHHTSAPRWVYRFAFKTLESTTF